MAEAWSRYWRSWRTLIAANLFVNLLNSGLMLWLMWTMFGRLLLDPGDLTGMQLPHMALGMLFVWPVGLIFAFFLQAGMIGAVASVWRDPDTPWTAFWVEGWRNWWRMIKVTVCLAFALLLPAAIGLMIVGGIIYILPLPLFIRSLLYILMAIFGLLPLMTGAGYYAKYAAVADGGGGRYAVRAGFRAITARYGDSLSAAFSLILLMIGIGLLGTVIIFPVAMGLGLAGASPVLISVVATILESILLPTLPILYMAVRYETNQR